MSVGLMSKIFKAEIKDLKYIKDGDERTAKASTVKLVLLAIADHANDYGESAYPGYDLLQTKTALSRQGLADTLDALEQNDIVQISNRASRFGTNNYVLNVTVIDALVKPLDYQNDNRESSHLTTSSQATGLPVVKPLDLNHQLTINKPSVKRNKEKASKNLRDLDTSEYSTIPEIKTFIEATGWVPGSFVLELIVEYVAAGLTKEAIAAAFRAWTARGYKPSNVQGYLDWARDGIPPASNSVRKQTQMQPQGQYFKI